MRAAWLVAMLGACATPTAPASEIPPAYPSVTGASEAGGTCVDACATMARLHCPEAAQTDAGETCAALCARVETDGIDLHTACVARAADVSALRACGVRCIP